MNEENKKHYLIYQTTNLVNGKIYIGKHTTENIEDQYFGSGKYLRNAINKYGLENFQFKILFELQNEEEMNLLEKCVVTQEFCDRKDTYNINVGGDGGWDYVNSKDGPYSRGSKKRSEAMIQANKNRDNEQSHIKANQTRQNWSEEKQKEVSKNISNGLKILMENDKTFVKRRAEKLKGRKLSKELRQKLSQLKQGKNNNQFGKVWIINKTLQQCKCVDKSLPLEDGWEYGRCLNFNAANQKKIHDEEQLHTIEQHKNDRLMMFRNMYKFFVDHNNDFELTAEQFNYSHTRNAFMTACRILLPEYKPLPNNRWKNRK